MPKVIDKVKFFDQIGYKPHSKQKLYHASKARFKVPVCGRRMGKSTMAARDMEPELFLPNRMYWICAPTYDLGEKEFRVIWQDLMIKQGLGKDKRIKRAYSKKQGNMYIEFPWGTRVEVRSAQHPENLVGEGLHGVIMSEAAKHSYDTWERYIRPALSDYRGWATFPTTPEGQNWLYNLWQYGQNPNPEYAEYESWQFPSWENRIVFPGGIDDPEIVQQRLTTSKEWFDQEYGADFTAFVGRIYYEFQEVNNVRKCEYNPLWRNVMCFDWGFNTLACIEFQIDPWDNIHIWREHYSGQKSLGQHLHEIKARPQPEGYKIDYCFGDAADPAAAQAVTENLTPCVVDNAAKENYWEGIELVKTFLKAYDTDETDEYGTPIQRTKLFVDHMCVNTIREFNNYKVKEGTRNTKNKSDPPDQPQKHDDHALDAIRYGLMHMFKLGAQHHLADTMALSGAYASSGTMNSLGSTSGDTIFKHNMEF